VSVWLGTGCAGMDLFYRPFLQKQVIGFDMFAIHSAVWRFRMHIWTWHAVCMYANADLSLRSKAVRIAWEQHREDSSIPPKTCATTFSHSGEWRVENGILLAEALLNKYKIMSVCPCAHPCAKSPPGACRLHVCVCQHQYQFMPVTCTTIHAE
jgi:hypothetical protein